MSVLKLIAAKLPHKWLTELKRIQYKRQINNGNFSSPEPEYQILADFIAHGDWVIDIGANVGHYTKRFSDLVGPEGRVIAFEPIPTTFSLLAANILEFDLPNVTLFNTALSSQSTIARMSIPDFESGLSNFYRANISSESDSPLTVLTLPLDSIINNHKIKLLKIDVEGHEAMALDGMMETIRKYHPVIILETGSSAIIEMLNIEGYKSQRLPGSPNMLFIPL
jgi:FkbM family methyltransferase